jgi:hypothetical protein
MGDGQLRKVPIAVAAMIPEIVRLRAALRQSLGRPLMIPVDTRRLDKEAVRLSERLGGAGEAPPPRDRVREAVVEFRATRELSTFWQARLICHGVIEEFPDVPRPLIEDDKWFLHLLAEVDDLHTEPRAFRRCYRGLLRAYFAFDPDATPSGGAGAASHRRLRSYLKARLGSTRVDGTQCKWVDVLYAHRNLLTEDPVTRYGPAILSGDSSEFDDAREGLEIGPNSWIMRRLVLAQVRAAVGLSDEEFVGHVDPLLSVLRMYPLLQGEGLAALLDRYQRVPGTQEHSGLRDRSVEAWGNPGLAMNDSRWGRVQPATRTMVRNWLNLNLIRQFFSVLAEDRNTDQRRVRFWEKYHALIDDIYFAFGPRAAQSRLADIRKLREQMGNRLLTLIRPGKPTNNAFIMRMGAYLVVEFGVTGNACQVFRADQLPFVLAGEVAGDGTGLKHPSRSQWLPHRDSGSDTWEDEFRRVLAGLGIRPSRDEHERGEEAVGHAGLRVAHEFSWVALRRFADAHGLTIEDLTRRGGRLWVSGASAPEHGPLTNQLVGWGFRWANHRAAWYRVE